MRSIGRSVLGSDRKITRLNSSHTEIYTLSLHDALPISLNQPCKSVILKKAAASFRGVASGIHAIHRSVGTRLRSEDHTSELQSHRDLHSFPTRRSSDLA